MPIYVQILYTYMDPRFCLTLPSFISFIVAIVIIASVPIAITFAKPLLLAETEGIETDVQGGHALTFLKTVGTPEKNIPGMYWGF